MPTYAVMKAKIQKDMDIEDETFIQDTELLEYFNDAIRDCEGHIQKLGLQEEWYLNKDNPSVVAGTAQYDLPSDIYLKKFVECVYNDGSRTFEIKEIKGKNRFTRVAFNSNYTQNQPIYSYYLLHATAAAGAKWVLDPVPTETSSTRFTRWYIRAAQKMTVDASICDVPDVCLNFIYAYVTWRIWAKEGDGRAVGAKQELELQRTMMVEILSDMTPDGNNEIELDTSTYDEMS